MKYLITKRSKKLTKDLKNKRIEIVIPENQMIELAYKTPAGENRKEQIIGAYVYLKIGDTVYPSIVEFSGDEVRIVGDSISREDMAAKAIRRGRIFFVNNGICTCREFIHNLFLNPNDSFTVVKDNKVYFRVVSTYKQYYYEKKYFTIVY